MLIWVHSSGGSIGTRVRRP